VRAPVKLPKTFTAKIVRSPQMGGWAYVVMPGVSVSRSERLEG